MNSKFDELAKGLAQSVACRGALKQFCLGLTVTMRHARVAAYVLVTLGLPAVVNAVDAVAISGGTAVVGSSYNRAAYVFVWTGTNWSFQATLTTFATEPDFGHSVAISGDTVAVGSSGFGTAYVFARSGTNWSQQAFLTASNFGGNSVGPSVVSLSGDTLVVGTATESSSATGVNSNQINDSAPVSGAAYVFVRNGTTWSQQAYLKASNTGAGDNFGCSVSISSDTVVVGARYEDSNASGVNGNQSDNSASDSGSVYVFVRNGTSWSQQAYLKASKTEANDNFGHSVAISGGTAVVGAPYESSKATCANGDQSDNSAAYAGAAYAFVRNGTSWSQQAYLKASNTDPYDRFGYSVAISGDSIVVGSPYEASNATGINGNERDNSAQDYGAAYFFARNGANWGQPAYLKPFNVFINWYPPSLYF